MTPQILDLVSKWQVRLWILIELIAVIVNFFRLFRGPGQEKHLL
jgi:hypothetical protein